MRFILGLRCPFGGADEHRLPIEIDAEEFIGEKSIRAKGKRVSNYEVNPMSKSWSRLASLKLLRKTMKVTRRSLALMLKRMRRRLCLIEASGQKMLHFMEENEDEETN